MKNRYARLLLVGLLVAASVAGAMAVFSEVEARGRCFCPMVYDPVICDNGKTYSNQCVATCRGGKNCEPAGFPTR